METKEFEGKILPLVTVKYYWDDIYPDRKYGVVRVTANYVVLHGNSGRYVYKYYRGKGLRRGKEVGDSYTPSRIPEEEMDALEEYIGHAPTWNSGWKPKKEW